jgi:hypothetical protein
MIEIIPGGEMSYLKKITVFFALTACLLSLYLPALGAEAVKSNLDVLTELAAGVANELIAGFQSSLGTQAGVRLIPRGEGETYEFLMNVFTAELTSRGIKTYSSAPKGAGNAKDLADEFEPATERTMELNIQALEFSLTYPKIFRSYLIGGRNVKRRAEITVFAELLDTADRSVAWVGEASKVHDDQFSYGDRAQVEESLFTFTKPEVKPASWGRIVEPVVVSGIIVGLVYLFFSNQSDN